VQVIGKNNMHVDRAAKSGIILPCVFSLCIPFRVINMFYLYGCALIRRVADTPGGTYWQIGTESLWCDFKLSSSISVGLT